MTDEQRRRWPPVVHPLFLTHPVTGKKVLYCNPGFAERINELPEHDSGEMLKYLFAHQLQPQFRWTNVWVENDVLVAHLVAHNSINADPARLRQCFEPGRNVYPVTVDVAAVLDDVAEIYPHSELDPPSLLDPSISFSHLALDLDGTAHCVDNAAELDEKAVASGLDDAPAMLLDSRVCKLASQLLQRGEGAFLIRPHQPRITGDVGRQNRREPPLNPCLCHIRSRPP
jgi:hypothetical protein